MTCIKECTAFGKGGKKISDTWYDETWCPKSSGSLFLVQNLLHVTGLILTVFLFFFRIKVCLMHS